MRICESIHAMRVLLGSGVALLTVLLCPSCWADDGAFIQTLQIRGTRRPLELETHAGQTLDPARIERDVRQLWASGWFEDVWVERTENPDGVGLIFALIEKPRFYLRRVEFEPGGERRPLGLRPGTLIDKVIAHQVAAALRRELHDEGYRDAQVEPELIPAGFQEADLLLRVDPGPRFHVSQVEFSGPLGVDPKELRQVLQLTRARQLLPGLPLLWRGWRLEPPFSERALEADLERVRAFYLARGYFDARVGPARIELLENTATIRVPVESGRRYLVRGTVMEGVGPEQEFLPSIYGEFQAGELCHCLLEARRRSEASGALAFEARLEIEPAGRPPWARLMGEGWERNQGEDEPRLLPEQEWVMARAEIDVGPAYRVGRIEFRGHRSFSDLTLRRVLRLEEGGLFDRGELRRSLAQLNQLGLFEPLSEASVHLTPNPQRGRVDLTIFLKERPRGRWQLSGPLGPISAAGPLQFAVETRLPPWGHGLLELSTYTANFSLFAFSQPVWGSLGLIPKGRLAPLLFLKRPLLPGQGWQSGFVLSPQYGWREMLLSYGLVHVGNSARLALSGDPIPSQSLSVPVRTELAEGDESGGDSKTVGYLLCESARPRLEWLRLIGTTALGWVLGNPL
jgi:outer membrane protein insertion porin family